MVLTQSNSGKNTLGALMGSFKRKSELASVQDHDVADSIAGLRQASHAAASTEGLMARLAERRASDVKHEEQLATEGLSHWEKLRLQLLADMDDDEA
jgi:hypothetical protein